MSTQAQKLESLARQIKRWAEQLGFQKAGITDIDLADAETHLLNWLDKGWHGEMTWMGRHGTKRSRPQDLVAGTVRVISVRMDYLPDNTRASDKVLEDPQAAFVSRYAVGRDYHKVLRKRLQKLTEKIQQETGPFGCRVFTDSAPVLEKALAEKAGLGWIGKNTNLIDKSTGSWFFLGEIYTDLDLPVDKPSTELCGTCTRCIDVCPTDAIVGPWQLDARRCISYLTIEHPGTIPESLRPGMGNRIYGCDDCQLVCPWNKFAKISTEEDFEPRHELDSASLIALFAWDEKTFLMRTAGSAIRRIGHERWVRNIAIALGNANSEPEVINALRTRQFDSSDLIREHVEWALRQHKQQRHS